MTNSNVNQQEKIWTNFSEAQKSVLAELLNDIPLKTSEEMMFCESLKTNNAQYKIVGADE